MDIETEKLTAKGQVTIPLAVRKKLGILPGDQVVFVQDGEKVYLAKGTLEALTQLQNLFAGKAEETGLKSEDDIVCFSKKVRQEMQQKK